MQELLVDFVEPLALVGYAVLAAALTLGGLVLEFVGLSGASGGAIGLTTLWPAYMGAIALFGGYVITRDELLPRLRRLRA